MEEIKMINSMLQEAKEYNLETEVVWSALETMKCNSKLTVVEAMQSGLNEWIK